MKLKYLPGLNTLRFFAASFVVISHANISLDKLGIYPASTRAFVNRGGDAGMLIDYQLRYLLPKLAFLHLPKMFIIPLYYIILLLATIAVAALSYHYFEKFFLRLKDRLHNKHKKLSGNYVSTKN